MQLGRSRGPCAIAVSAAARAKVSSLHVRISGPATIGRRASRLCLTASHRSAPDAAAGSGRRSWDRPGRAEPGRLPVGRHGGSMGIGRPTAGITIRRRQSLRPSGPRERPAPPQRAMLRSSRLMTTTTQSGTKIPLPPMNLRLMRDSDEQFVKSGISLARLLYRYGLQPDHALIDVGCSVGRVPVGLLAGTDFHGRYLGFDVMKRQVTWAAQNIAPVASGFTFAHL